NLTAQNDCQRQVVPVIDANFEQAVVKLVNDIRANNGLPPLKLSEDLSQSARYHAMDMAQDDYFEHDSYDRVNGQLALSCSWSNRIDAYYSGWQRLAENIAAGYTTPQEVVDGWMNSPGHRDNILSDKNWEIGVGYFGMGGTYGQYWAQDFGRRFDVFPVIINGEAAQTDTGDLSLYVYGDWQQVRMRTDDNSWSDWQPFQPYLTWKVLAPAGEHTVSVELQNGNQTVVSSDTIVLTKSTAPDLSSLPDTLAFIYSVTEDRLSPAYHEVAPLSGTTESFTWHVQANGNWFNILPADGTPNDSFQVVPADFNAANATSQNGVLQVQVTDPQGNVVANRQITLQLQVINAPMQYVFIPFVMTSGN
ncbi:MAG: CAP domain-containing protein, partial [Candidatus Zixiibacteriota bacterium]